MIELRWVEREHSDGDVIVRREKVLQYRQKRDIGGPYPNIQWTDWTDVPTVREGEG